MEHEKRKVADTVREAMKSALTKRQREVVTKSFLEGKKTKTISQELRISKKRVASLKAKAREKLKEALSLSDYRFLKENRLSLIKKEEPQATKNTEPKEAIQKNRAVKKTPNNLLNFLSTIFKKGECNVTATTANN